LFPNIPNMPDVNESKRELIEVESVLIICSDNPREIVDQIANLPSIGNFWLPLKAKQKIHDLYFDTSDRALRAKRMALRLREIEVDGRNKKCLLTFKGPSISISGSSGMERIEIEHEWSKDTFDHVWCKLQDQGIEPMGHHQQANYHPIPVITLEMNGLKIIQDRRTARTVKNVVLKNDDPLSVIAELAIDEGEYLIGGQNIRYNEIEIEAKKTDCTAILDELVDKLQEKFVNQVYKWKYSKLAMGLAIEKMADEKGFSDLIDSNGNLIPKAFKVIKKYLEDDSWT